ncbi:MAG TPA: sigma-54 dependent transcriptional regulator [Spirochaetales bacterium]|nr:sigma-54 dependent transcriptional regulator [Spirochaetales bacterium]HRY56181.1 sigma-54 dependent transcriptional regulator [Spirochaetia bacterium]HRZ66233.1 sigma-54 dependent transcriptional regulator [Spirochaetia bacterium]
MEYRVLIVDDERELCATLSEILSDEGYATRYTSDPLETIPILERERIDLVILDIRMPGIGGIDLLKLVRKANPAIKAMILTGHPSVENAVLSMKYGAVDFFEKPPNLKRLLGAIREFAASGEAAGEPAGPGRGRIVTGDPRMQKLLQAARTAAATAAPVLITGESGTGKELIAGELHAASPRADRPFVKVNCAAIPEALLESELFGHEKGAFTSAVAQRKGKFELAHEGTIFLDEIGDMSPSTQAKILRALQEREFERVGGSEVIRSDIRVIAATNKDLRGLIAEGRFRQDLYYRLCVIPLEVPPLRERTGDIALLIDHFLRYFDAQYGKSVRGLDAETSELLLAHDWPGNVRELRNCVERAVIFCEGDSIGLQDLPSQYMELDGSRPGTTLRSGYEQLSRTMILDALQRSKGKKVEAAGMLNIDRRTLYNRMKRLGLS